MKKINQISFVIILLFVNHFSQAQTAEEIVEKYITAIGGREKFKAINTIIYSGKQDYYGTYESIVITEVKGALQRYDIDLDGQKGVWMTNTEFGGEYFPWKNKKVFASKYRRLSPKFKVLDKIITYKEDSSKIFLLGKFKTDSSFGYKIQLVTKRGVKRSYWFDLNTFLLKQSSFDYPMRTSQNDKLDAVDMNKFSNWQTVDGMMFPFTKTTEVIINNRVAAKKVLYLSSIQINTPVAPDLYQLNNNPLISNSQETDSPENAFSEYQ